jgi:membrane protein
VFSLITKIESAFNFTWHVLHPRKLSQHFEYLSVILLGPLMIFVVFGFTTAVMGTRVVTSLRSIEPVGALFSLTGELVPYLLVIATFTFFYLFVPNTRVKPTSALVGALISGLMWETSSRAFSSIVVTSARYQAVVSSLAIPLLFMIWLYVSWLILLIGAAVAFYHQHPEFLGIAREEVRLSNRVQEKLALLLVYLIGRSHYGDGAPWTAAALAKRVALPLDVVTAVLESLEKGRLVAASGRRETVYLPARPFEEVQLVEVLNAVRTIEEGPYLNVARVSVEPTVDELDDRLTAARNGVMADTTVKAWVTAPVPEESTGA